MSDPCFIEPFGICIAQTNAVSGAFLTAVASLVAAVASFVATFARMRFEGAQATRQQAHSADERRQREDFESAERRRREDFERGLKMDQQHFEASLARASMEAKAVLQRDLQEYVQLDKWREESWERTLERLEKASQSLGSTTSGLLALIDQGPVLDDLQMIEKTADVLDTFGEFKASVGHFALPDETTQLTMEIASHVTKTLLTLSPTLATRQSDTKRQQLSVLKD